MAAKDPFLSSADEFLALQNEGKATLSLVLREGEGSVFPFSMRISLDLERSYPVIKKALLSLLWMVGGEEFLFSCPPSFYSLLERRLLLDQEVQASFRSFQGIFGKRISLFWSEELPERMAKPVLRPFSASGSRIGIDLGGSDLKVVALKNGELVYGEEIPWSPKEAKEASYHESLIRSALLRASTYLSEVDAVGVSSSGLIQGSEMIHPSLFASCDKKEERRIRTLLRDCVSSLFPSASFLLLNDGDATALSGASLHLDQPLLGLSLGTSLAAGYAKGKLLYPYINELSKVPVNASPEARFHHELPIRGSASEYLSQKGLICLLESEGFAFEGSLPERLLAIQKLADSGNTRVLRAYEEFGRRLGEGVLYFSFFYDFSYVFLLGRVMSGKGGERAMEEANRLLASKGKAIRLFSEEERKKRLGQAIEAACLAP